MKYFPECGLARPTRVGAGIPGLMLFRIESSLPLAAADSGSNTTARLEVQTQAVRLQIVIWLIALLCEWNSCAAQDRGTF